MKKILLKDQTSTFNFFKIKKRLKKYFFCFRGLRSRNRNLCYEILSIAYFKTKALGIIDGDIIYDCKSTLFTSSPINLEDVNFFKYSSLKF